MHTTQNQTVNYISLQINSKNVTKRDLRLFKAKSIFMFLLQTIQVSISTQFKYKYSLIVKTSLFLAIRFFQAVLIQLIQFTISRDFVYTQLNVKTVLY